MEKESTTAEIIKYLLSMQSIKYEQNVKHKLHEFVVKYTTNLIEESRKYSNHAGREFVNEDDVRFEKL
jgi:Transcription initiation factor TFIID, subunit TAF9 (also component of histone acetyltransferase SAGA)